MKKKLLILLVLVVLVLDWAALDDITTGNEPDYIGEWLFLWLSLLMYGLIGWWVWQQKRKPKFPRTVEPEGWMVLGDMRGAKVIEVESRVGKKYLEWTRRRPEWRYLWKKGRKYRGLGLRPRIVLVFGPSGSGKDVVTGVIEEELRDKAAHLSSDWYYGPLGKMKEGKIYANNYDHVNAVDWELLKFHLRSLRQGYEIKAPVYDFSTHFRVRGKSVRVKPKPIILVSGIMVAEALRREADLVIGVDATWEVCVKRRIRRDIEERGRTRTECERQIKATVRGGYEKFVKLYLKMLRQGKWDGKEKTVLVDNLKEAEFPLEPARVNKAVYLEPIRELLER